MSFSKWHKNCTPKYKQEKLDFPYMNMKMKMKNVDL